MSIQAPWKDLLVEPLAKDHVVQLYRDERFVVEAVALFAALGIGKGEAVILVATAPHLTAVEELLDAKGVGVEDVKAWGQLTMLDASELLSRFMVNGLPDAKLFKSVVEPLIRKARGVSRPGGVRVYGEMVNLLWRSNVAAAARLESLWNEVIHAHGISLFCAYALAGDGDAHGQFPHDLRAAHSHVIPVEACT
jgi:hypothetical protein